ncbi:hypothetical protein BCR41DRAFT_58769 [Lobosporangium transversale]|uniref:Uncharacterized protein n=1 Tax=Lobosporangium transversale TaxID=64571 RepID=A0A1Y2GMZ4_9FUNG|nr:hypothetical protein BCR41DRAFT_58769 [Lobosporangium transversale]ORZ16016.1 hypothetical protein BCR41DRAFT_58769 [Lobosporangium transversale]|eukprot:XP_021881363.1 hypothetical protein BCR41DRAFT_58769 [Lobosporangium transversale]
MTTDTVIEELAFSNPNQSNHNTSVPPSPPLSAQKREEGDNDKTAILPSQSPSMLASLDSQTITTQVFDSEKEKETTIFVDSLQSIDRSAVVDDVHDSSISKHLSIKNSSHGDTENDEQNCSIIPAAYSEKNGHEVSYFVQHQDGSLVEQQSYSSVTSMDHDLNVNDAIYLNSTTEFIPVDDQDEQVYLEQYSEEGDDIPVLQYKVTKLQKQVREMRKFMRGLVQLQIEQYEPATILIQAWWRGCLVRRELKKQRAFSWHRNPKRSVKPLKYLTKAELYQSCERISAPKASLLVTEDLGAQKDTIAAIKLQAVFRSYLVRRRVHAYREGMRAATIIQARWRGYRTRNLDTRLGVEQLRFRNLKVQKAFGRVSIKLQYLQGRILALEENSLPLHEAQELIHKEIEEMGDQIDNLKQELDQGLKQLDEQVSEEKEQTTIEIRTLTERIQKLEEELKSIRNSNTSIEKQVKSLTLELPANAHTDTGKSDQEDEDYEVQYDEDGNRIEKPPKKSTKRASFHEQLHDHTVAGSRRTSTTRPIMDTTVSGSPTQIVGSPVPMQQPSHRGSIGSVHSQGHARTHSLTSQPPPSPGQTFPRAFPASYSPTISNAAVSSDTGAFTNGIRSHSIPYPGTSNNSNNSPRSLTIDPNQLFRFHPAANQFIPLSPSSSSATAAAAGVAGGFPGMALPDPKKYVSVDDFEYMQAEVDTLRLNNDRLEGIVLDLTMRLNTLAANMGQFYPG